MPVQYDYSRVLELFEEPKANELKPLHQHNSVVSDPNALLVGFAESTVHKDGIPIRINKVRINEEAFRRFIRDVITQKYPDSVYAYQPYLWKHQILEVLEVHVGSEAKFKQMFPGDYSVKSAAFSIAIERDSTLIYILLEELIKQYGVPVVTAIEEFVGVWLRERRAQYQLFRTAIGHACGDLLITKIAGQWLAIPIDHFAYDHALIKYDYGALKVVSPPMHFIVPQQNNLYWVDAGHIKSLIKLLRGDERGRIWGTFLRDFEKFPEDLQYEIARAIASFTSSNANRWDAVLEWIGVNVEVLSNVLHLRSLVNKFLEKPN